MRVTRSSKAAVAAIDSETALEVGETLAVTDARTTRRVAKRPASAAPTQSVTASSTADPSSGPDNAPNLDHAANEVLLTTVTPSRGVKTSAQSQALSAEPVAVDTAELAHSAVATAKITNSKRSSASKKTAKSSSAVNKSSNIELEPTANTTIEDDSEGDITAAKPPKKTAKRGSVAKNTSKASASVKSLETEESISTANNAAHLNASPSSDVDTSMSTTKAKRGPARRTSKATSAKTSKIPSVSSLNLEEPVAAYSTLAGISLDVAREIWAYLDVDSLSLLHYTLNRSIQRLMHSRSAIERAMITSSVNITKWILHYFLLSIKDVGLLHLDQVVWKPELLIQLLRSANPRELVFGKHIVLIRSTR